MQTSSSILRSWVPLTREVRVMREVRKRCFISGEIFFSVSFFFPDHKRVFLSIHRIAIRVHYSSTTSFTAPCQVRALHTERPTVVDTIRWVPRYNPFCLVRRGKWLHVNVTDVEWVLHYRCVDLRRFGLTGFTIAVHCVTARRTLEVLWWVWGSTIRYRRTMSMVDCNSQFESIESSKTRITITWQILRYLHVRRRGSFFFVQVQRYKL